MPLNDPITWLTILSIIFLILFFVFDKAKRRTRIIIGLLCSISLILVVYILLSRSRSPYTGWVICWHGYLEADNTGHEFLVAYPEAAVRDGVNLAFPMINPWNKKSATYLNDSLKACFYNNNWYGGTAGFKWFPKVSYLKLEDGKLLVCDDVPGCSGQRWFLDSEGVPPDYIVNMLQQPQGNSIQIINYIQLSS